MKFSQNIKRSISVFLLCVFAFSITPVLVLHTVFANHKDKISSTDLTGFQFSSSGFNCNTGNFVAEARFLHLITHPGTIITKIFYAFIYPRNHRLFARDMVFESLRGPPPIG